jgi:hypothetical protein
MSLLHPQSVAASQETTQTQNAGARENLPPKSREKMLVLFRGKSRTTYGYDSDRPFILPLIELEHTVDAVFASTSAAATHEKTPAQLNHEGQAHANETQHEASNSEKNPESEPSRDKSTAQHETRGKSRLKLRRAYECDAVYWVDVLDTDEQALKQACGRAILVHGLYKVFASGQTYQDAVTDGLSRGGFPGNWKKMTWRARIVRVNHPRDLTREDVAQRMQLLQGLLQGLQGAVDNVAPQVWCACLLFFGYSSCLCF